jgi:hypothetical protein
VIDRGGAGHRGGMARSRLVPVRFGVLAALAALAGAAEAAPAISISPASIEFYAGPMYQDVGAPPGELQRGSYEVRNVGDAPLVVTDMVIAGPGASLMAFDGALDPSCGSGQDCALTFSLAPGEARLFLLTCTAAQPGYFGASLGVTSNAVSGAGTAALSCVGLRPPIIQITPVALDFGISHRCEYGETFCYPCGTQPLTQTLTITNAAAPPSRLDFYVTPELPSTQYDDFIVGNLCADASGGCSVPAGAALPIEITFRPYHDVLYTTPLAVVSRYPGQAPIQVPFYAEGGHGQLVFDTPDYLGDVAIGQTLTKTLTVHNAGRACLSFQGPDSSAPEIQVVGPHPSSLELAAGASHSWTLACTPELPGPVSSFIDFELSWESIGLVTQVAYCVGVEPLLAVSPASLAFTGPDEVPLGASAIRRVTVQNVSGQDTALTSITSSDPRFTAALAGASLPLPLAPGATAEVDVEFTPTGTARAAGAIAFGAAGGAGASLGVIGDGALLQARAQPAALDFGAVVYSFAPTQRIELRNTGERPLTVAGVELAPPADFRVVGLARGATVAAGEVRAFDVRATPTVLGRRRATVAIKLDRIADLAIPLDAIAVDPAVAVTTTDAEPDDYALDLGAAVMDGVPRTGKIVLQNARSTPIEIAACAFDGDGGFSAASACPFTVPGHATGELAIGFMPLAGVAHGAAVTLTGTGLATGALRVELRGVGVDPRLPAAMTLAGEDGARPPLDEASDTASDAAADAASGGGCGATRPAPGLAPLAALWLLTRRRRRPR